MPQIGYFNIGARGGDTWCLPIGAKGDEDAEWPEEFMVELMVSDINVVVARRKVAVTIISKEGECEIYHEKRHMRTCSICIT